MAIVRNIPGVRVIPKEALREEEEKFGLERVGEFIAPSTTRTLKGLATGQLPTGRQLLGSALEVGSLVFPGGAVARSLGLAGKVGVAAIKGAKKLTAARRALRAGKELVRQAKIAGIIGGISGAGFGAGRALGDEEKGISEVLGEATIGGLVGAAGGAVLVPATSLAVMGARGVSNFTQKGIKIMSSRVRPQTRNVAIDNLTEAYRVSFLEDNAAIMKALEKEVIAARRFGGPTDEIGLLRELAEEGYTPIVQGKLARMRPVIDNLNERISGGMKEVSEFLSPIKVKTSLSSLIRLAKNEIRESIGIDQVKALRDLSSLEKAIKLKFGKNLKATQLNDLRIEMNKVTKAFGKEQFAEDTKNILGRVIRQRIDDLTPAEIVRRMNVKIARLGRMRNVAKVLNDKPITVEFWGEAMGRFLGTVGGAGLGVAVAGPGGLVVAGVLANMGSRAVAGFLRRFRFNPGIRDAIIKGFNQDEKLIDKVLQEASIEDAKIIRAFLKRGRREL